MLPRIHTVRIAILASGALAFVQPFASGEVIHLTDGSKLVGRALPATSTAKSTAASPATEGRIETVDGIVGYSFASVLNRDSDESFLDVFTELNARPGQDADGGAARQHAIARYAAQRGLFDLALDHADRAIAIAASRNASIELHAELFDLPIEGSYRNSSLGADSVAALLDAGAASTEHPARAMIARGRLVSKIAEYGDTLPPPITAALARGLVDRDPRVRAATYAALAASHPTELATKLGERLVAETDQAARTAVIEAARAYGDDQRLLVPVLAAIQPRKSPQARAAAMDALEHLGDKHAVASLIRALASGSGYSGTTSSMSVTNQVAYVSDFDVEVAQASAIADPIVSVAQDGVTLDVTLYGVSERGFSSQERARIGRLLDRLTGHHHGTDVKAWQRWLTEQKKS